MKQIVDHDLGFVAEGKITKRNVKVNSLLQDEPDNLISSAADNKL